ncbi:AtzG-like protein [Ramlibacter sp. WS9]|uniref:AtzG-like protein n=1 Tax=Ramlibacter sp. WS9 TaxID=1882741 RepID=UPI001144959B|nr:AtzG-like protein [Ramlibacter sp. WS9]ROZ79176.1 DUF4089 domain-containing protein [Ramlibacter sp. WS9]
MDAAETLAYVKAAAIVVRLPLDDAAAQRVAEHMSRTAAMARMLDGAELAPDHELAEIFRPAPFPKAVP